MPIIFTFTDFDAIIAIVLFFAGLICCGLTGIYLDSEKEKKYPRLRLSLTVVALLMIYCEYCAVNIGFTLNPPKNATFKCVEPQTIKK